MSSKGNNNKSPQFDLESDEVYLKTEPVYGIDKYTMINVTKQFDYTQFQGDNSKKLLTKLIYGLHQGFSFSESELEFVFFKVTKLLQSNDPVLRILIYKTLRTLRVEKYTHILTQSLQKDLMNSKQLVRVEALRFISIIQEQHINSMERFIQQAILDKNTFISSTALIVGIKIVNMFQHIVKRWQTEIYSVLNKSQQINYHALILLYEMSKYDRIIVDDILKFTYQPQQQIINLQILKLLKEISLKSDQISKINEKNQLFLNQSINDGQTLIFLESYSIILQNRDIQNIYSQQIDMQFTKIFKIKYDIFEVYKAIKLLDHAIKTFGQTDIVILKVKLEIGTLYSHAALSALAILSCIQQQEKQVTYLQYLFNQQQHEGLQYNFLEGLCELVDLNPEYYQLCIEFLQLISIQDLGYFLRVSTIQFLFFALYFELKSRPTLLKILFRLPQPSEIDIQFQAISLIGILCFQIDTTYIFQLKSSNTSYCLEYLKNKFENGSEAFYNDQCQEYNLIRQELLEILCKENDNILIDRQNNLENIHEINGQKLMDNQKADSKGLLTKNYIN